jgi:hypothetical protein
MNHPEYAPGSQEAVKRDEARQQKAQRRQEMREKIQAEIEDIEANIALSRLDITHLEKRAADLAELFAEYVEVE